jgi:hypothetical protein
MQNKSYETPQVVDYGDLTALTANNENPVFVDVPQGTPIADGPIIGDNPFPDMS